MLRRALDAIIHWSQMITIKFMLRQWMKCGRCGPAGFGRRTGGAAALCRVAPR